MHMTGTKTPRADVLPADQSARSHALGHEAPTGALFGMAGQLCHRGLGCFAEYLHACGQNLSRSRRRCSPVSSRRSAVRQASPRMQCCGSRGHVRLVGRSTRRHSRRWCERASRLRSQEPSCVISINPAEILVFRATSPEAPGYRHVHAGPAAHRHPAGDDPASPVSPAAPAAARCGSPPGRVVPHTTPSRTPS
jgi:hypothetical protein